MNDARHLVLIAYAVLALLAAGMLIAPPKDSGDMAAWVQGVGTVVAIAVAGWVGLLPSLHRQREQQEATRRMYDAVAGACAWSNLSLGQLSERIAHGRKDNFSKIVQMAKDFTPIEPLDKVLVEPLAAWPHVGLYMFTLELQRSVRDLLENATEFGDLNFFANTTQAPWEEAAAELTASESWKNVVAALTRYREARDTLLDVMAHELPGSVPDDLEDAIRQEPAIDSRLLLDGLDELNHLSDPAAAR